MAPVSRPHINDSIDKLEDLFLGNQGNPAILNSLADELKHRNTLKSHDLRLRVTEAMKSLRPSAAGTQTPRPQPSPPQVPEPNVQPKPVVEQTPSMRRVLDVIEYLNSLARVNMVSVRDLANYETVLWLDDVPQEGNNCFSRHWGLDESTSDEIWIDVKKLAEPPLQSPPKICAPYVDEAALFKHDTRPQLRTSVPVVTKEADAETGEPRETTTTLYLQDHPDAIAAWEAYIQQKWTPWSELRARYLAVQKIFGALFSIHQEQQRLGEQYELVLSFGLLTWRQSGGGIVRRHLIAAKASLEYEAAIGRFHVKAAPDGDMTELELDMLEAQNYPSNADSLVEMSRQLRDNVWDATQRDALLTSVANSLEGQGRGCYDKDAVRPSGRAAGDIPLIEYAPALILRKRTQKSLINLLADMRRHIEAGGDIPEQFLDLCEVGDEHEGSDGFTGDDAPTFNDGPFDNAGGLIHFPLPANEQQRQIIRMFERQRGVLVQGPPGTGKSQTITNLICHLLASGKRILVTAKTPRALEVLHDKLPPEVSPLCISMLGSGNDERASLEKSVSSILGKVNNRNDAATNRRIAELETIIHDNRKAKVETENTLIALREKETYEHHIAGNTYSGTAAAIAIRLRAEHDIHAWFDDAVKEADACPLAAEELERLEELIRTISPAAEVEVIQYFPDINKDIPAPETLRATWDRHAALQEAVAVGAQRLASANGVALAKAGRDRILPVQTAVDSLVAQIGDVLNRPMPWLRDAVKDILNDLDAPWKEIRRLTYDQLKTLNALATKVQGLTVDIPPGTDRRRLANDARNVRDHLASGKGLTNFLGMESKVSKEHASVLKQTFVDGRKCVEPLALSKIIDFLTVETGIQDILNIWKGKTTHQAGGHFLVDLAMMQEHIEALDHALTLYEARNTVLTTVSQVVGLTRPQFSDNAALAELAATCHDVLARMDLFEIETELGSMDVKLSAIAAKVNAHPLCKELVDAFRSRDIDVYFNVVDRIRELNKRFGRLKEKQDLLCRLAVKAPKFSAWAGQHLDVEEVATRLDTLEAAWAWRRAASWLEEFQTRDTDHLERTVKRIEDSTLRAIGELAAHKAWMHCFSRMSRHHMQHLETWQQAMRRLGLGRGRHAHRYRQDAQGHLSKCKGAVPAWIMPLHRVYETVEGKPKSFDVVIVDEASQCGFEALPLLYLADKIIVVGDENQISPEAVGVDRSHVENLMKTHLKPLAHKDSFDVDNSLFAHGRIRFGNRITLREHFRCAPEIIRFSNDLCYLAEPLIPLKQCLPNRLKPLCAVHVPGGYRDGSNQSVINKPEAEALVAQVAACVKDSHYDGMTFGVIALQGDAQAKLIESMLIKAIGTEEMQERRLLCGNPYSFQGDERDVVFLSLVTARDGNRIGAMVDDKAKRRFNVAASRAREQMWLFHSVTLNDLSTDCIRRRLLGHFLNTPDRKVAGLDLDTLRRAAFVADRMREPAPYPFDSWFEVDVALDIAGRGYTVVPQFEFAGKKIDLVIQGGNAQFAVECDGDHWHGRDAFEADMVRQRMLERCNWVFFRVRECAYRSNPEDALKSLWPMLDERGIYTGNGDSPAGAQTAGRPGEFEDEDDFDEVNESIDEEGHDSGEEGDESACALEGCPVNIDEALDLRAFDLRRIIYEVIKARPNQTCVRRHVTTMVLRTCQIRTRSGPRRMFQRKVESQIAAMIREGHLVPYKATNDRLRLGREI